MPEAHSEAEELFSEDLLIIRLNYLIRDLAQAAVTGSWMHF